MPGMCSVPGCKGYKKARSRGVVFHSLPTRDPGRCRKWLRAIQNPKFDENTPVSKYGNIRVCSQHFKPEDYEPDIQAVLMKTPPRKILKCNVIPSVFSGRQQEDLGMSLSVDDRNQSEGPSTSSQASLLGVQVAAVDAESLSPFLPVYTASVAPSSASPQSPSFAEFSESMCSAASVERQRKIFHQEAELSLTAKSKSDKNTEQDLHQLKTIVNDSCLMELFKKCQTCGQSITQKKVSHCGAQKKVRWSCLSGHRGIWMSSPYLWETFPEIHLLMALSILFSGGTFTQFKKLAKHLHLNFMEYKTFCEIQKTYLNTEMKQMNRSEQEGIYAKRGHQQPEDSHLHISDPVEEIQAKSMRREQGFLSSWSRCKQCQKDDVEHHIETAQRISEEDYLGDSYEEMEVTMDEDECDNVKNRLSDSDSDIENVPERTKLNSQGTDDSSDEDVYVPIIPQRRLSKTLPLRFPQFKEFRGGPKWAAKKKCKLQMERAQSFLFICSVTDLRRSTTSHLVLECEEEELEPWQKQTSKVQLKDEDDVGELSNDQKDSKPDPSLQTNAGFIVVSAQLPCKTELIGSLRTQCCSGNSSTVIQAAQHELFQKEPTATIKTKADDIVHTSEEHLISNSPVSLSSVYAATPAQLQLDQSNSQILPVPIPLPCFTVLKLELSGTSMNSFVYQEDTL